MKRKSPFFWCVSIVVDGSMSMVDKIQTQIKLLQNKHYTAAEGAV